MRFRDRRSGSVSIKSAAVGKGMLLVVEHSKLETAEDICPHFGICGGCLYQPIPYEKQLAIKEKQVRSLLDAVCPEYEFEGILGGPLVQGYRNKIGFLR